MLAYTGLIPFLFYSCPNSVRVPNVHCESTQTHTYRTIVRNESHLDSSDVFDSTLPNDWCDRFFDVRPHAPVCAFLMTLCFYWFYWGAEDRNDVYHYYALNFAIGIVHLFSHQNCYFERTMISSFDSNKNWVQQQPLNSNGWV